MIRISSVCFATALVVTTIGCQRDDTTIADKLDQIDKRLQSIETTLAKGGGPAAGRGAAARKRPQRPRPKPNLTYSVPIEGAATKGPANAKVTVVEAFEFA